MPVTLRAPSRTTRVLVALAMLLALSACSAVASVRIDPNAGGPLSAEAGRLVVVVLRNPAAAPLSEPGSTPHGYQPSGPYRLNAQTRSTAQQLARSYHLTALREWPIEPLRVDCLVFRVAAQADRDVVLRRLSADRRVRLAQPLQQFSTLAASSTADRAAGYNDPYLPLQWGFSAMHTLAAQRWSRGQGVRVAVIDTGADIGHPDLAGRIQTARNFVDADARSFAADPHGTLVAGIIAAVPDNGVGIVGVSPDARLAVFKACEPLRPRSMAAQCNSFTLALALSAAIEQQAQIVNLSLAGPADPLLQQLVVQGERRGMIFVGAVPPDGALTGFPLAVPGVVAVQESERQPSGEILPAPGRDVVSLTPAGHYDFASGASFAAAQISGALALMRAAAPHADPQQLTTALRKSIAMSAAHGQVVDVCRALSILQPSDPCEASAAPSRR